MSITLWCFIPSIIFVVGPEKERDKPCFVFLKNTKVNKDRDLELGFLKAQSENLQNINVIRKALAKEAVKDILKTVNPKGQADLWIYKNLELEFIPTKGRIKVSFNAADRHSNMLILKEVANAFIEFSTSGVTLSLLQSAIRVLEVTKANRVAALNALMRTAKGDWTPADERRRRLLTSEIQRLSSMLEKHRTELKDINRIILEVP